MIYKPKTITKMWDTWLYYNNGTYYLYYLVTEHSPGEGICLATSSDGVHWTEHGLIFPKADDALWLGTGSVWPSSTFDRDGKYIMNFSEWRGPQMGVGQQTIFFAESTDLVHWTRLDNSCEFKPDPRWYRLDDGDWSRWDCIYAIPRPGGGYYGYWTGNPKDFHPGFGFGETLDGVNWRCLPAPVIEWGSLPHMVTLEVGAVEPFNGKYYAMLGSYKSYMGHLRGMFQFVADSPHGPFRPVLKNYAVIAAPERMSATYFARFFPTADGILANHQSVTRSDERTFAPLKTASVDDEGVLRLGYWRSNDALKGEAVPLTIPTNRSGMVMLDPTFDLAQGIVLEGDVTGLPLQLREGGFAGVGFYLERNDAEGTAVRIHTNSFTDIGLINRDGTFFRQDDRVDRALSPVAQGKFRLLLRQPFLELYVNDVLIQCYSLPEESTNRIGLLYGAGQAAFDNLTLYRMTL